MRRFRNPRYAPEALERKLSPSGVGAIPVTAEIYVPTAQASHANSAAPPTTEPTQPGDPEPVDPTVPTGGTDPAPPDGTGNPPAIPPVTPDKPADPTC